MKIADDYAAIAQRMNDLKQKTVVQSDPGDEQPKKSPPVNFGYRYTWNGYQWEES